MIKIIGQIEKSTKEIDYQTDHEGGKYAVIRYRRKKDGKVYRTKILHGV